MVSNFVRDDESHCELTSSSQILFHGAEKVEVEVNILIAWAIERADGRGSFSASRANCAAEDHQLRLFVPSVQFLAKELCPNVLVVLEHNPYKLLEVGILIVFRRWRHAILLRLLLLTGLFDQLPWIAPQKHGDHDGEDQEQQSATCHPRDGHCRPTAIFDILRFVSTFPTHLISTLGNVDQPSFSEAFAEFSFRRRATD